ncbi:MAG: hypothetical protein IT384_31710 [Deltaproteobacteria bacterium]|nr:hypothetical protein [Deltaproteobacteria bacterium]
MRGLGERGAVGLSISAVLVACAPEPLRLSLDPLPGAKSAIIAVERGPGNDDLAVVQLVATALPDQGVGGEAVRLPEAILDYAPNERLRITAIGLVDPLAVLGLAPGALATTEDPDARPLTQLGPTAEIRQLSVGDGAASPWSQVDHLAAPLGDVRVDTGWPLGCTRVTKRAVRTETTTAASFALALDDHRALVGLEDQTLFRIEKDGSWENVTPPADLLPDDPDLPADAKRLPTWGVLRESPEILWLCGRGGLLWRVRIDAGAHIVEILERHQLAVTITTPIEPRITRRPQFRWIGGAAGASGVEIFLLSVDGVLARFDREGFVELARFELGDTDWRGGLAYLGPGRAVAGFITSQDLIYVRDRDQLEPIRINQHQITGATGVGSVPGLGVIVSDTAGNLFRSMDGASLQPFGRIANVFGVDSFLPYRQGFIAGGTGGFLQQWRADRERLCPEQTGLARQTFRYLAELGGTILATGPLPDEGGPLSISLLDPATF